MFAIITTWWLRAESNHRHEDFQSSALPTELRSQIMAVPTRIELAIFCVTGRRDNRYTTRPKKMVAGAGFEPTTFGLWAQRATRLLHPAIINYKTKWRRKRDSNPRAVSDLPVFKTGPFNQTWVFLQMVPKAGLEPARDMTPAGF